MRVSLLCIILFLAGCATNSLTTRVKNAVFVTSTVQANAADCLYTTKPRHGVGQYQTRSISSLAGVHALFFETPNHHTIFTPDLLGGEPAVDGWESLAKREYCVVKFLPGASNN